MANEAQIASKTQKQVFDLLSQTVTEAGIRLKDRNLQKLFKKEQELAGPLQLLQQDVKQHPDHYHVLYLEHGSSDDLKQFFKEQDVQYLELAPSVIEHNSGGFIISDTDYKRIKNDPMLHIQHRYTEEQLEEQGLDENGQNEAELEDERANHPDAANKPPVQDQEDIISDENDDTQLAPEDERDLSSDNSALDNTDEHEESEPVESHDLDDIADTTEPEDTDKQAADSQNVTDIDADTDEISSLDDQEYTETEITADQQIEDNHITTDEYETEHEVENSEDFISNEEITRDADVEDMQSVDEENNATDIENESDTEIEIISEENNETEKNTETISESEDTLLSESEASFDEQTEISEQDDIIPDNNADAVEISEEMSAEQDITQEQSENLQEDATLESDNLKTDESVDIISEDNTIPEVDIVSEENTIPEYTEESLESDITDNYDVETAETESEIDASANEIPEPVNIDDNTDTPDTTFDVDNADTFTAPDDNITETNFVTPEPESQSAQSDESFDSIPDGAYGLNNLIESESGDNYTFDIPGRSEPNDSYNSFGKSNTNSPSPDGSGRSENSGNPPSPPDSFGQPEPNNPSPLGGLNSIGNPPSPPNNNPSGVYVSDDVLLDDTNGRSHETLDNAIYNATVGSGVEEAHGSGRKHFEQTINSIAGGQAGLTGIVAMRENLTNTLSTEEVHTLSVLMKTHAAKTGNGGGGLDFSTIVSTEKSFDDLHSFFTVDKLAESHSAMGIRGSLAVDSKMEYGRNKFGRESIRRHDGSYVQSGDFTKNHEYAAHYIRQLQAEHNKTLKKTDPNFITDDQVNHLIKTLTKDDGKNTQKLLSQYETFKLGQNMRAGKAGQKTFSLNWKNNAAVQKALSEDETYQGLQKPKTIVSNVAQARKMGLTASRIINERQALIAARQQAEQTKRIAELKKAGKANTKEFQDAISKAKQLKARQKTKLARKTTAENRLKAQNELKRNLNTRLKTNVKNRLNRSELGKKILRSNAAVQNIRLRIIERFRQTLLGKMFSGVNAIRQLVIQKLMGLAIKFIGVLSAFLLFVLKMMFWAALIGGLLDLIMMFTLGNNNLEDDPAWGDIESSIMGNVYNQLYLSEAEWANYLKYELFEIQNPVWLDELSGKYTNFDSSGNVDWDHFNMSAEDYITEIIGTEYVSQDLGLAQGSSGIAKGPEPFPGAPEGSNTPEDPGAYKWIRLLDGGIEVRFRGIGVGNTAGKTSNIKEIMAMTSVAQMESHLVTEEIDEEGYEDIENASAWERLGNNLKKFWNAVSGFFNAIGNALTNGFQKLARTIPAYDEWWQNQVAKQKTQTYMLYAAPLFEYSHVEEYSLELSIRPTLKTYEDWIAAHPEEALDAAEDAGNYNWGFMCSGISDQTITSTYRKGQELNEAGTDYHGDHEGYGCMEFDGFAFKYDSDQDMYYDGVLAPQVKASWDVDNETDICVVPGSDGMRWLEVTRDYGHDDCWTYLGSADQGWQLEAGPNDEYGHADFIDAQAAGNDGYNSIFSDDGGETYIIHAVMDERDSDIIDHIDEDDGSVHYKKEYYIVAYRWGHDCQGDHTGYYCGGHFKTVVTGGIYHMSSPQLQYNEDEFEDKYIDAEMIPEYEEQINELGYDIEDIFNDNGILLKHFHRMYDNNTGEVFLVDYVGKQKEEPSDRAIDACRDLFDVDDSYTHRYGHVNIQIADATASFFGWDYAAMNAAVTKLEDDWYELYGIRPPETIGGTEGGVGSAKGLATALESGETSEILAALDELYADDPSWPLRRQAIETALTYVGKISYSQARHGSTLAEGGLNDCSGYVSQCWKDVLQQNYTTASFWSTFSPTKWDSNIKPGDIILHYDGAIADGSGDHALIYIGKDPVTGEDMSVDCSGGGTYYRSRGSSYYNSAYYINMSEVAGY